MLNNNTYFVRSELHATTAPNPARPRAVKDVAKAGLMEVLCLPYPNLMKGKNETHLNIYITWCRFKFIKIYHASS